MHNKNVLKYCIEIYYANRISSITHYNVFQSNYIIYTVPRPSTIDMLCDTTLLWVCPSLLNSVYAYICSVLLAPSIIWSTYTTWIYVFVYLYKYNLALYNWVVSKLNLFLYTFVLFDQTWSVRCNEYEYIGNILKIKNYF